MRGIVVKVVVNAVALWVATLVVPGVSMAGGGLGKTIGSFLVVGAIFGVVNTVLKPIVRLLAFPFYLLTLGLLAFVVNALLLELVGWLARSIGIEFDPGPFFWSTLAATVVVWLVSMVLSVVVPDGN